jgi:hypothetical protein
VSAIVACTVAAVALFGMVVWLLDRRLKTHGTVGANDAQMQRHSYLNDLLMMYTGATASRVRGVFFGIVVSAIVGYVLNLVVVLCLNGSSIWLSIPIFTMTYTLFLPLAIYIITRDKGQRNVR